VVSFTPQPLYHRAYRPRYPLHKLQRDSITNPFRSRYCPHHPVPSKRGSTEIIMKYFWSHTVWNDRALNVFNPCLFCWILIPKGVGTAGDRGDVLALWPLVTLAPVWATCYRAPVCTITARPICRSNNIHNADDLHTPETSLSVQYQGPIGLRFRTGASIVSMEPIQLSIERIPWSPFLGIERPGL
jgi:hypothetical protein